MDTPLPNTTIYLTHGLSSSFTTAIAHLWTPNILQVPMHFP